MSVKLKLIIGTQFDSRVIVSVNEEGGKLLKCDYLSLVPTLYNCKLNISGFWTIGRTVICNLKTSLRAFVLIVVGSFDYVLRLDNFINNEISQQCWPFVRLN